MSSQEKSHFSLSVIWRNNPENQRIEFLVQDVVSRKPGRTSKKQTKFAGGNNRINCTPEETPELTAQREILEELYLSVSAESLEKIWEYEPPPDFDKAGKHTKYGFLVPFSECRGDLRTEVLDDSGDEMGVPYWLSPEELKFKLFNGHQAAFINACRVLGLM